MIESSAQESDVPPGGNEEPAEEEIQNQPLDFLSQNTPPPFLTLQFLDRFVEACGTSFQGKIELGDDQIILRGVMGDNINRVFFGYRESDQKLVVVRMLHAKKLDDRILHERFLRERHFFEQRMRDPVQYWPRVLHEAKIQHPEASAQVDCSILEFLPGMRLDAFMQYHSQLASRPSMILAISIQLAHAMEFFHEQDYVLRDLKPDNIMIVGLQPGKHFVRLFDANMILIPSSNLTPTDSVVGTPEYMAPEQARGLSLDGRTDIYALGCLMYEMLAGHPLFSGAPATETMRGQIYNPVPKIQVIDPALENILLRFLEKDPRDRPRDAREAREVLKAYFLEHFSGSPLSPLIGPALDG